jgi:two-component system cell cycle sensor histidine kinase/response regulator CckA
MSIEVAVPLRILHLEDNVVDAELVLVTLREAGIPCTALRVDAKPDYVQALDEGAFDLIISDLSMPSFDGKSALALARQKCPDVPFIFVSGTIGEESAIDSLLSGATDYVLKHRFSRLVPAVQRALTEAQEHRLRMQMQEQLAAASNQLRNLFENLDDVFVSVNVIDRTLSQVSPACERISGWKAVEFLRNPQLLMDSVLEQDRPSVTGAFSELHSGKTVRDECRIRTKEGAVRWLEFQLKPVFDENLRLTRVDGAISDVTDQKTMERQLLRSQRLESIGTLASGIAHDLNNVLTPIMTAVQLLRDRTTDKRSVDMLGTLELSTIRGAELIKQVLAFARGIEEERSPVRLPHVFSDVAKILEETLPRSISTYTDIPRNLWCVRGDSTQLHQLLLNLCVNARDAMPSGGELAITARNIVIQQRRQLAGLELTPGPYVMFDVRDTGEGIATEALEKIFDPFFTTKPDGQGTGLGLFTVKAIVRSHRGFIDISTQAGKGSVFTVYLPADATVTAERTEVSRGMLPSGSGQLVLLVDDEASVRDIVGATLEAYGYRVLTAANGAEGLKIFQERGDEIHLVLSDMNMPVMDGNAMIKEIRRLNSQVSIVAASGLNPELGNPKAPITGPRMAHIQKPFTARELLWALKAAVGA